MKFTRRLAMQIAGASALMPAAAESLSAAQVPQAPKEGAGTPKLALGMPDSGVFSGGRGRAAGAPQPDPSEGPKRIKQLGVNHVLSGGGTAPWTEESLTATMAPWKAMGISVSNLMINLSPDIIYGKAGSQ
ncbi:MAG TPA: hypothetical protein VNH18_12315, partial [Bryobacteraceae bacterium]|nr:hypothetical protein [Bryobacteraceae bacterium]